LTAAASTGARRLRATVSRSTGAPTRRVGPGLERTAEDQGALPAVHPSCAVIRPWWCWSRSAGSTTRCPPGYAPGEHHSAYDYARTPDSLAARWFSDAETERALDFLAAEQDQDGGQPGTWPTGRRVPG
jgi:hypothetical protein